MSTLEKMFAPESVAVIGASRRTGTLGKMFLDALVQYEYQGKIFPVNPKADKINNLKCYPDIVSLPQIPDLAVILLPREHVPGIIDTLGANGVKNVVVISAGFRETGEAGRLAEESLLKQIRRFGMRMIGPNSMGLFNTRTGLSLNATFSPTPPIPGHVAFISQSGALGVAVLEIAMKINLGFSLFVSTGNKADIGDTEVLAYAARDANTRVIALYQESIDNTKAFRRVARETVPSKPILVLKAGRTDSGLRAAASHTGALASSDLLTDAFLTQCGILRCGTLEELLYTAYAFSLQPLPAGNRVAVITNAGGPGILASDALERAGMAVGDLAPGTREAIKKMLPPEAGINNPVDMIASATHETYREVYQLLEQDPNVDIMLIIIVKPPVATTPGRIIQAIAPDISASGKPVYFAIMADPGGETDPDIFRSTGITVFPYPELAAQVIGNHYRYSRLKRNVRPEQQDNPVSFEDKYEHRQAEFITIADRLKEYNIPLAPYELIRTPEAGRDFLRKHGSIALKAADAAFIHKSDQGLVHLNISSGKQLREAYNDLKDKCRLISPKSRKPAMLIQAMITGGLELVLGARHDPVFGHTIMFGIGGIFVELYRDVVFRVLPIDLADAQEMIGSLKAGSVLDGFRNFPAVDKPVIMETILNFSHLIQKYPDILEMDLNPLIWSFDQNKPLVVDARMTVTGPS
jgi:acetyl coenzyme A synthetase (ADP forming)-like protein